MHYKEHFIGKKDNMKSLAFAVDQLKTKEFRILKRVPKQWLDTKKCRTDATIYREAKKAMNWCDLYYIKDVLHWEPAENALWFTKNVLCDKKMPYKKFRLLYEWVEDEIDDKSFILASDVRYQAGVLVGAGFDKSAKFKDLGKRMKKFLKLTVTGTNRTTKWIPKV